MMLIVSCILQCICNIYLKLKFVICRSYYRCTHSVSEGCLATKIVQEEEHGDSPMFRVIYRNKHTCNTFMSDGAEQIIFTTPPMPSSFFVFGNKKSNSSFANLSKQERRYSLSPINEDTNGEKFNLHNEGCSSLINNSMLSDSTMAMGNDDTSNTPMIKYSPTSPMGLLDYYEFDFGDVDSILSSLEQCESYQVLKKKCYSNNQLLLIGSASANYKALEQLFLYNFLKSCFMIQKSILQIKAILQVYQVCYICLVM